MNEELLNYFSGDELAAQVWLNKYALKDSEGNIYEKTPDDMHRRLASEIARVEHRYPNPMSEDEIFDLLKDFKYIVPQGGPMTGIGNPYQIASLSNCFVIGNKGVSDSYGGIMKIDEEQVQLMKRRGGVGHDLSHIRPNRSPVMNSALTSTGIVPFMERYSNSTREVAQDGRRGALMLSVDVRHPDTEHFVDAKMDGTKITGANVSVKITDDFMEAVVNDTHFKQQYPINSVAPTNTKMIKAKELWDKIIHNAWKSAEPGVLFWDTVINESIPDCYSDEGFRTVSTNPCGEIPLCPYDSCRLLAINLLSYVVDPFTDEASFDMKLFKEHVQKAQKIMDDIIDLELEKIEDILNKINNDPEEEEVKATEINLWKKIRDKCNEGRRTGVGITAEGDMLAAMGLTYGSDKSTAFAVKVHKNLALAAYRSSVDMAKDRGAFPIYDYRKEENNPMINRIKDVDPDLYVDMVKYGRRNIALLTIAPTGTTSIMTQTSSGIEPVFMTSYKRRRKINPNDKNARVDFVDEVGDSWEEYMVIHKPFEEWIYMTYPHIVKEDLTEDKLDIFFENSPWYKATANDVNWLDKVKMQGAIQKWIDHSISVTVNIPEDTTEEMVSKIYQTGWESGCKGITVYRDGSRSGVLISKDEKSKEVFQQTTAPKREKNLEGHSFITKIKGEDFTVIVGLIEDKPYEIFAYKGRGQHNIKGHIVKNKKKSYSFVSDKESNITDNLTDEQEAITRGYSFGLRHGGAVGFAIEQLNKTKGDLTSFCKAIARVLSKFDEVKETGNCPNCKVGKIIKQEGCESCDSCDFSKC